MGSIGEKFEELVGIIAKLRDPEDGCPWDLKQTHTSLKQYLIEESYEVLEAIDEQPDHIATELGDVLLQVVLHSQIGKDDNRFSIEDVITAISTKMVDRHPHVFGDKEAKDSEEVLDNWETQKRKERGGGASVLDGVPKAMPALQRAQRLGDKASRVNFDWNSPPAVFEKVEEEYGELKQAIAENDSEAIQEEFGDLLFSLAQYSRKSGFVAEEALQAAVEKFCTRFKKLEKENDLRELSSEELEARWQAAKV